MDFVAVVVLLALVALVATVNSAWRRGRRRYPKPTAIRHEDFFLGTLLDGSLRVVEPIRVKVREIDGWFVLEACEIDEVSVGRTLGGTTMDLQEAIGELYHSLRADPCGLGRDLTRTWDVLRRKIVVRHPAVREV